LRHFSEAAGSTHWCSAASSRTVQQYPPQPLATTTTGAGTVPEQYRAAPSTARWRLHSASQLAMSITYRTPKALVLTPKVTCGSSTVSKNPEVQALLGGLASTSATRLLALVQDWQRMPLIPPGSGGSCGCGWVGGSATTARAAWRSARQAGLKWGPA
jgi:hypothetical protein